MAQRLIFKLSFKGKILQIGKDGSCDNYWYGRWDDLSKSSAHLICARHSKSIWDIITFCWKNRNKPYGFETRPLRKYFHRYAGLWAWQICYSDEVNYAGLGKNLLYELFDYWRTCHAAKKEYNHKIRNQ